MRRQRRPRQPAGSPCPHLGLVCRPAEGPAKPTLPAPPAAHPPGPAVQLSRLLPRAAKPLAIRKITMYSAQWVRSQSRMNSNSNQETFRWAEGRGGRVTKMRRECCAGKGT